MRSCYECLLYIRHICWNQTRTVELLKKIHASYVRTHTHTLFKYLTSKINSMKSRTLEFNVILTHDLDKLYQYHLFGISINLPYHPIYLVHSGQTYIYSSKHHKQTTSVSSSQSSRAQSQLSSSRDVRECPPFPTLAHFVNHPPLVIN